MSSESKPSVTFGPASAAAKAANTTVPELISQIRSTFLQAEFEWVEKVLADREESLKRSVMEMSVEVENRKKEYNDMEKQHGELVFKNLKMEADLMKYKRETKEMRERVSRLIEEKNVLSDREKRADERYDELSRDFSEAEVEKKIQILELNDKIRVLNGARGRAEAEVEAWKKKFNELDSRVSKLEEDSSLLLSRDPFLKRESEKQLGFEEVTGEMIFSNGKKPTGKTAAANLIQSRDEKTLTSPGAGSTTCDSPVIECTGAAAGSQRHKPQEVIEIDDSDDERPDQVGIDKGRTCSKRKRASSMIKSGDSDDDVDKAPIGRLKRKNVQEPYSQLSSDSSENDSDHQMDSIIASFWEQRENKGWKFVADMLQAFGKDIQLCMNAVCCLHRQRVGNLDALRVTALAEFLIDGDEKGRLRKSVSELQQFDPKAPDDCRKLAQRNSTKLFDIYQKKEDPFFPPP